jgi:hypothetical protein
VLVRTIPYVTVGEFRFHPTFLDTNNLVSGGTQAQQDSALNTALLTASEWADVHLFGPEGQIAAHTRVENARIRPDRQARLRYHPEHTPVSSVVSLAIGDDPTSQTTITGPTVWVEQGGRILVAYLFGAASPGLNAFQFGRASGWRNEQTVTWTYVAGWAATQLSANAAAAAPSVQVLDATGITAGTVLRLWTPGLEEAVTVSSVSGTTLTLSAPLTYAHSAGDSIQAVPTPIREAVVTKAICELLRPNAAAQQPPPKTGVASTSTRTDPARNAGGGHYHDKACGLLRPYRRWR